MAKTIETIRIPGHNQSALVKKIAGINRRALKLGCEELVLTFAPSDPLEIKTDRQGNLLRSSYYIPMVEATLEYIIPKIDNYSVVACFDIVETDTAEGPKKVVFASTVPGATLPAEYHEKTSIYCDHCGTNRLRFHSILLQHDDGEYKEVGTSCIKDFFGHDPKGAMMMASLVFGDIVASLEEEDGWGGYGSKPSSIDLDVLLGWTAAVIRKIGWLSKSKAEETGYASTAYIVETNMFTSPDKIDKDLMVTVEDEDKAMAKATIEYFQDMDPGTNDYLINCCKLADIQVVPDRFIGYACSMVASYQRELQLRAENESAQHSEWVGKVGERMKDIPVSVKSRREFESDFGVQHLYIFTDKDGNILKTFYSGSTWYAQPGEDLVITGTVKSHDEWHGSKQTLLSRVAARAPIAL